MSGVVFEMLVDTDILIDYLRGRGEAALFIEDNFSQLHVSSISVAELYQGVRDGAEREALREMLEVFRILELTKTIAVQGGLLRRQYGKSHGSGLADCLIASTAIVHEMTLFTLNLKHYPMLGSKVAPYGANG